MSFLKKKITSEIILTVSVDAATANKIKDDLILIIENINSEELALLAKAVKNPIVKASALKELKKLFA